MIQFKLIHPKATEEMLGYIPTFLSESDPRPAREQFNSAYGFAGGWQPFKGHKQTGSDPPTLLYPGDRAMLCIAETTLHSKETIRLFESAWVSITQPDGTYEIARMD